MRGCAGAVEGSRWVIEDAQKVHSIRPHRKYQRSLGCIPVIALGTTVTDAAERQHVRSQR